MTSAAPDCSPVDFLFDPECFLKENSKDLEENYTYHTINEEWNSSPDEFLDSILQDNYFSLGDLDAIPSSSSDSGVSSGLPCEQSWSPLLSIEDDQNELMSNNNHSSQNFMDSDSVGSPNDSVGSADSPMRSVTSSDLGSPATDVTEEMESETSLGSAIDPAVVEGFMDMSAPIVKEEPMSTTESDDVQPPILKLETPITLKPVNPKRNNIRQLVRVTPVGSGNPRSILLPISLKDMKEVRTIKIINAAQAKNLKGFKINQGNILTKAIPVNIKQEDTASEKSMHSSDEISETESPYPRLKLNNEEKRLLQKEGITLPSHYPLTKHEERELKRIRRKIRNKISAQDSRKRKKEYVDGLEDRVKQCTEDNMTLLKRIKALQTQNQSLAGQLKRVQALIQKGNKSAQPATCLMVLLVSLALVVLPNLNPHSNNSNELSGDQQQPEKNPPLAGRSRSLLFTKQLMDEELQQCGEDLLGEVEGLLDHDYSPVVQVPFYKRPRYDSEQLPKYSLVSDGTFASPKIECSDINKLTRKYIEPPLDDVWPPPKPSDMPTAKIVDKLEELTNELKINISDADGMRTVLVKVPQEI